MPASLKILKLTVHFASWAVLLGNAGNIADVIARAAL